MLNREGFAVGRRHVATLMQRMGFEALYRKPNTSKRHLLRSVNEASQVNEMVTIHFLGVCSAAK